MDLLGCLAFRKNGVQTLLMGGQACVFYGAAQVSKDVDRALPAEAANILRLGQIVHGSRRARSRRRLAGSPAGNCSFTGSHWSGRFNW